MMPLKILRDEIRMIFGETVSEYVYYLSDISKPEDGNREFRKTKDREHTARAPKEVKIIKLADLIHNTRSIVKHDKNFAKVYMKEKILLLEVLKDADLPLFEIASKQVMDYYISRVEGIEGV
jgi:(p)ppGpp synthase/HD superfamily hydrolase